MRGKIKSSVLLITLILLCIFGLCGCDTVFDVHPYDVHVDGNKNVNARQMARIKTNTRDKDTLKFAFISDSHQWLDDLEDEVRDINRRQDIDFVIHGGDVTDFGATREFEWTRDRLEQLKKPFVVLLGNHDCLGTGYQAFEVIFGKPDFSFITGRVKFVCLNTNAIEYDYSKPVPNFDFMEEEMTADSLDFDRTVICMHSGPYSEQFNNNVAKVFNYYTLKFPNLMFCLQGHGHHTAQRDVYENGVIYYEVADAEDRQYYIFTITPEGYSYEIVDF